VSNPQTSHDRRQGPQSSIFSFHSGAGFRLPPPGNPFLPPSPPSFFFLCPQSRTALPSSPLLLRLDSTWTCERLPHAKLRFPLFGDISLPSVGKCPVAPPCAVWTKTARTSQQTTFFAYCVEFESSGKVRGHPCGKTEFSGRIRLVAAPGSRHRVNQSHLWPLGPPEGVGCRRGPKINPETGNTTAWGKYVTIPRREEVDEPEGGAICFSS